MLKSKIEMVEIMVSAIYILYILYINIYKYIFKHDIKF